MSKPSSSRKRAREITGDDRVERTAANGRRVGVDRDPRDNDTVETTAGNIFEDLGLPDARVRLEKAELARIIRKKVSGAGWKQREAATHLGLAQSDVSDLLRGKLARFSVGRLHQLLMRLGLDVHIHVDQRMTAISDCVMSSTDLSQIAAPAFPTSAAQRPSQAEWEKAALGVDVSSIPLAMTPKWRAAPDLSRSGHVRAGLYRVPLQSIATVAGTADGNATAAAGPFVYVPQSLAIALNTRSIKV